MIYFDKNKHAYGYEIENPLCVIEETVWQEFSLLTLGFEYDVTSNGIVDLRDTKEYKEKKAKKERKRLDALFMTRSDFFDGFILAFNLGQTELRAIVENILNQINITDIEIKVALNNFDNALNFYRKHTLFTLINNVQIPISETMYLLFTDEIWDKFFDTKDYKELQKAIHQIEPEEE